MDNEIKELKSILRSLVVSSPAQVDVRSLLRDYRSMVGTPVPITKFGYRDPVVFLRDKCDDCFLFQGPSSNPILTLIVPDTLKHIDKFVKSQKASVNVKFKGKRRSVPVSVANPAPQNLIAKTYPKPSPVVRKKTPEDIAPDIITNNNSVPNLKKKDIENNVKPNDSTEMSTCSKKYFDFMKKRTPHYNGTRNIDSNHSNKGSDNPSSKGDTDSGNQTSSTSSSTKLKQLEELKAEIREVVVSHPDGVLCTDLIGLYRERYNRELNFTRFGYTSIVGLVCAVEGVAASRELVGDGDLVLRDAAAPGPEAAKGAQTARPRPRPRPLRHTLSVSRHEVDVDDALPGIDFDAEVFPADCMHFMESIPSVRLEEAVPGGMLPVIVGEVYSPSHFWLIRLGDDHNIAMENMMDDMTNYYSVGEGKDRCLALGAVRVGHYCSSVYERDWHRSLIVKIIDSGTVKVRHVDYGTVDTVPVEQLKPLRRVWSSLPAQAVRARLGAVRPAAAGRRWPRAACTHLLTRVRDRRLVAYVVARDLEEQIMEVLLIDTSTNEDVNIGDEMIKLGHADARPDSALKTSECYLYPRFEALENGDTPNYAEIHGYLRDGIALEFVDAYRRHVPSCLPTPRSPPPTAPSHSHSPAPASTAAPAPAKLVNRVPLMRASESSPPEPHAQPAPHTPPAAHAPHSSTGHCSPHTPSAPYPHPAVGSRPGPAPGVTLSVAECEVYRLLSRVNPDTAHWYMVDAIGRAMSSAGSGPGPGRTSVERLAAGSMLNPAAPEFRLVTEGTQTEAPPLPRPLPLPRDRARWCAPPPGFEGR